MPIDPRIAMGFQPTVQLESPLNRMAKFQQLESGQRANELAKMQMQEYQRGLQEQEQVRNYLSGGADISSPETLKSLYGFGKTGAEMAQKVIAARKDRREAEKSEEDLASKVQSRYLNNIGSAQSFKELADVHQAMFNDPVLGPLFKQSGRNVDVGLKAISDAQASQDPTTAFRNLQLQMGSGVEKYLQTSKPTVMQQGNRLVSIDPVSGRTTVVKDSEYNQPMTEFQRRSLEMQERLAEQGITYQTDANGNIIALPTKMQSGGVPVAKTVSGEGGAPAKAKLTPLAEKTAEQRKQMNRDLTSAITEIENAIKPGGLLDKSTSSGLGKIVDTGAAFFGKSTEGAQAAAALKPIADLGLKMIPRFEGPQSDKDTQSYKEASGQLANESLPIETRRAAAKTLVRLMKARQGQFVNQAMANEGISPSEPGKPSTAAPGNRPSLDDIFGGKKP